MSFQGSTSPNDAERFSLGLDDDEQYGEGADEFVAEDDIDAAMQRAIEAADDDHEHEHEQSQAARPDSPSALQSRDEPPRPLPPILPRAVAVATSAESAFSSSRSPERGQAASSSDYPAARQTAEPHLELSDLALSPHPSDVDHDNTRRDSCDDAAGSGGGGVSDYATSLAQSARSALGDQSSLRGLAIVVGCSLLLLSMGNFAVYILSSTANRTCSSLDGYVLSMALLAAGMTAAVPMLLRRLGEQPQWASSRSARALGIAGAIVLLAMGGYTVAVFVLLSTGVCRRSTLLRQTALLDGVLLCSGGVLLALYGLVRVRYPALSVSERGRALWRSHSVRLTLCLIVLALCTANVASVLINGRGRTTFHHAIGGWSACRQAQDCHTVDATRTATQLCRDERGRDVDLSYCADLAPIAWSSPCPTLKCPQSTGGGDAVAWNWNMPDPGKCSAQCDANDPGDGTGGPELEYALSCWDLRGHRAVIPGRCARKADASRSLPTPRCPPNPCHSCDELYRYNLVYAALSAALLVLLAADTAGSFVALRRDAAAGISEGNAGGFAKLHSEEVEATDPEAAAAALAASVLPSPSSSSGALALGTPRSRSLLSSLVARAPRLCFLVATALLVACTALSLWACTHLLRAQCRDSLAISLIDAVVTFNAALAALLLAARARHRAWRSDNPLEAIGLL